MTASDLVPLTVAVPLVAGAICEFLDRWSPRWPVHLTSIAGALLCAVAAASLTAATTHGAVVHWFGGWTPRHGVALGIAFVADPVGSALSAFAGFLTAAAMAFAWRFYDRGGSPFHALMLTFLAAVCGEFLTGDLFNMLVFFELMGVSAYALTAYRTEDRGAVLGAISFAVVNTAGSFLLLTGIALVYARTGALNMAQIAHALGGHADALVVASFTFIVVGLLVKAAVVPFQLWLPDAHAVAPTPLCVLFSGIMVQTGLYDVARVYWSSFSGALASSQHALRTPLLVLALASCFVGAVMCYRQRHLKRLLAFSTIADNGIVLAGIALFTPQGLAGAWLYVIGHGLVKGSLFMCSGVVLNRLKSLDVDELCGEIRGRWWLVALLAVGALGLAGVPPFGTYLGAWLIGDAARHAGLGWLPFALLGTSAITGGAVLNALGRLAFGWGTGRTRDAQSPREEEAETDGTSRGLPGVMLGTATALLAVAFVAGFFPGAAPVATAASRHFVDREAQIATILAGVPAAGLRPLAQPAVAGGLLLGVLAGILALALAAWGCFGWRARRLWAGATRAGDAAFAWLHAIQTGVVTDYVAWLAAGTVALGAAIAAVVR